jgi:hypothetical protein
MAYTKNPIEIKLSQLFWTVVMAEMEKMRERV